MGIEALLGLIPVVGIVALAAGAVYLGYAMFTCWVARLQQRECPYN